MISAKELACKHGACSSSCGQDNTERKAPPIVSRILFRVYLGESGRNENHCDYIAGVCLDTKGNSFLSTSIQLCPFYLVCFVTAVIYNVGKSGLHCHIGKDRIFNTIEVDNRALILNINPPRILLCTPNFQYHHYQ